MRCFVRPRAHHTAMFCHTDLDCIRLAADVRWFISWVKQCGQCHYAHRRLSVNSLKRLLQYCKASWSSSVYSMSQHALEMRPWCYRQFSGSKWDGISCGICLKASHLSVHVLLQHLSWLQRYSQLNEIECVPTACKTMGSSSFLSGKWHVSGECACICVDVHVFSAVSLQSLLL